MTSPALALVEIGIERLAVLADKIVAELQAEQLAARDAVRHAVNVGLYLIEAKRQVPRGQWLPWLKDSCHISSERTGQRYMWIARRWTELPEEIRHAVADLALRNIEKALAGPSRKDDPDARPTDDFELLHQHLLLGPTGPTAHTDLILDQRLEMVMETISGYTVQDIIVKQVSLLKLRDVINAALEIAAAADQRAAPEAEEPCAR